MDPNMIPKNNATIGRGRTVTNNAAAAAKKYGVGCGALPRLPIQTNPPL